MLLDRNGSAAPDAWTRSEGAAIGNTAQVLVPWEALPEALAQQALDQQIGVVIANSVGIAELAPFLPQLSLIAIAFPAYSDGRGFSLARQLRRHDFTGTLRAAGPLIADQFAYALSCGFDEIELPAASAERQPAPQWRKALHQISHVYQRGYEDSGNDGRNILDQRRAGRLSRAAG